MNFFLFKKTKLQVFVAYLIGALYVDLLNKKNTYSYLKCIVYDKLLKPRQKFRITLYFEAQLM
jgi:disulfide oxidoreductase YuzD